LGAQFLLVDRRDYRVAALHDKLAEEVKELFPASLEQVTKEAADMLESLLAIAAETASDERR
jgi:predicted house-cleaning noncanonical NTP pyrophosphatase (MazG superfamily)